MLFLIMNIVAIGEEEQDFFSINLAHIPDLIQPEPIPPQNASMAFMSLSLSILYLC